jgi:hypothetical protein
MATSAGNPSHTNSTPASPSRSPAVRGIPSSSQSSSFANSLATKIKMGTNERCFMCGHRGQQAVHIVEKSDDLVRATYQAVFSETEHYLSCLEAECHYLNINTLLAISLPTVILLVLPKRTTFNISQIPGSGRTANVLLYQSSCQRFQKNRLDGPGCGCPL